MTRKILKVLGTFLVLAMLLTLTLGPSLAQGGESIGRQRIPYLIVKKLTVEWGDTLMQSKLLIDGGVDEVQLTVQGYSTQTSDTFVVENSAGTDLFVVDNGGNVSYLGGLSSSGAGITFTDEITITQQTTYGVPLTVRGAALDNIDTPLASFRNYTNTAYVEIGNEGNISTTGTISAGANINLETGGSIANGENGVLELTETEVLVTGNLSAIGTLGATGAFSTGGNITLQNAEEIRNDVNGVLDMTATAVRVSSFMNYMPQTPILIADDGWLTPTGTYQGIYAAGSIGFSRIYTTGFRDGDLLILYNTVAQTIVITDENDTNLNVSRTLGIGDNLTLIFTNTAWWETSYTDN